MAEPQEDDFDDLFSFGAGTESPATTNTTTAPASSSSDFDLLADLNTPAPAAPAADDDFDDLFGTPPGTPITPKTPLDITGQQGSLPSPDLANVKQSIDDFHVNDAETRDFLEWLDDDEKNNEPIKSSGGEGDMLGFDHDDDFDFDRMLAEADPQPKQSGASKASQQSHLVSDEGVSVHQVQQKQSALDAETKDSTPTIMADSTTSDKQDTSESPTPLESRNSQLSTGTITPEPISKPYVSACIEEELAFDNWNDETDGFAVIVEGDNSNGASAEAPENNDPIDSSKSGSPVSSPAKTPITTLSEAIRSNAATIDDVRTLFNREKMRNTSHDSGVSLEDRPYLWTKVICGKALGELDNGSLAESFREWQKKNETSDRYNNDACSAMIQQLLLETGNNSTGVDQDLISVLSFHDNTQNSDESSPAKIDSLVAPVVYAILQSGIPPAAASVVMSQIEPSFMPLLRLSHNERYSAVKNLHMNFYLLACYHLPLLVMHLDRQCPGWYWPRSQMAEEFEGEQSSETANTSESTDAPTVEPLSQNKHKHEHSPENGGLVPLSWFITSFAGELGVSCLDHKVLLPIWDYLLTQGDCSNKFFLAIAMLDKHSDTLLMSRGEEVKFELKKVLNFRANSFDEESFVGADGSGKSPEMNEASTAEWLDLARSLSESTPSSVINMLRTVDDRAVTDALTLRKVALDEKAKAQVEAEEAEKKRERNERDAEANKVLMKARLVSYYREHNPEKVDTIDKIYDMFDNRFEVLNDKLKKKYGKGFLPDEPVKDQVSSQTRHFFESVNKSISVTRKHVAMSVTERRKKNPTPALTSNQAKNKIALEVSPTEIIPHVCSTKGHNPVTGKKWDIPESNLKFYLIDCRPESIAKEQGRFPTAVDMGPHKLQDPDELQQLTEMFESLRGAVHICIMGEGFNSFPALYDHPLTHEEERLLEDDISRTSNCCLFFLKKGFPFVSILKGGFAAAHAFLYREGPKIGLPPSYVLVDYDPHVSLFAQLEASHQAEEEYKNAPAREKTARMLQKIIDNSMTKLTLEEQRLNSLASDLARPENVDKMKQSMRTMSQKVSTTGISFGRTPPLFMSKKFPATKPTVSTENPLTKEESSKLASIASFKEKMALKWQQPTGTSMGEEAVEPDKDEIVHAMETEANITSGVEAKDTPPDNKDMLDDHAITDSLRAQSIDSFEQQQESTVSGTHKPPLSQLRLKMGFSANEVAEEKSTEIKANDQAGGVGESSQLKNRFGFLKKPTETENDTTPAANDEAAGPNQVKNRFGFLARARNPTVPSDVNDAEKPATNAVSDDVAVEVVKNKFANLTKSFGTTISASNQASRPNPFSNLLQKREAISEERKKSDPNVPEQDPKQLPPNSPVKSTFDSFSKSFEAVKSGADKWIREQEDPFNPKNKEPVLTRFQRAKKSDSSTVAADDNQNTNASSESLLFMEDDHDDLEDVIDFGTTTESDTTESLSDPFDVSTQIAAAPNDLFSGLNPQPKVDPTLDLISDLPEEKKGSEENTSIE